MKKETKYVSIIINGKNIWVPIIKVKEGSKILWQVKAPKGILTFNRRKDAVRCIEVFSK